MLDISSLIDVSFLLLIYFVATSTLDPLEGDLEMTMPFLSEGAMGPVGLDHPVIIVNAAGAILMESELLNTDIESRRLVMLEDRLTTYVTAWGLANVSGNGPTVELEVDDTVAGQRFIDVMNCFAEVGIRDVRLQGF